MVSKDNDDGDDDCNDDSDPDSALNFGGADDGVNELDMLPSDEREDTFEQTSNVCDAVPKVCPFFYLATKLTCQFPQIRHLAFAITHLTTIVLPAWH